MVRIIRIIRICKSIPSLMSTEQQQSFCFQIFYYVQRLFQVLFIPKDGQKQKVYRFSVYGRLNKEEEEKKKGGTGRDNVGNKQLGFLQTCVCVCMAGSSSAVSMQNRLVLTRWSHFRPEGGAEEEEYSQASSSATSPGTMTMDIVIVMMVK